MFSYQSDVEQQEEEDVDLAGLLGGEEETVEEEAEAPKESSFDAEFIERFGVTPLEAKELVERLAKLDQERAVHEQKIALSSAWGVSADEAVRRVQVIAPIWEQLPEDRREEFDSVEGVKRLWDYYQAQQLKKGKTTTKVSPSKSTFASPSAVSSAYDFTQSQIDRMTDKEYEQNQGKIMRAYAQKRVNLTK